MNHFKHIKEKQEGDVKKLLLLIMVFLIFFFFFLKTPCPCCNRKFKGVRGVAMHLRWESLVSVDKLIKMAPHLSRHLQE
jgi:hypothetical protein